MTYALTRAGIRAIEYHLPADVLDTAHLSAIFPDWSVEKIDAKTGIQDRHIAAPHELSSDLAVAAAEKLFASNACSRDDIDFVLLCTQSPDYILPTTACLVQDRLGLRTGIGALDFNLGCSGFVYGLGAAKGLIETGQATNILLLTAETYSKFIVPDDRSVRTIFGDAAAATLVCAVPSTDALIGPFVYGTDGRGAANLIVETGGMRNPGNESIADTHSGRRLFMNGPEIFNFTLTAVPQSVQDLLDKAGLKQDDVDLFVFHQANKYMLDHLRKRMKIPEEKFYMCMSHCGNTVSSTIPIALKHAAKDDRLRDGMLIALVGFGVGYSWGATLVRWSGGYTQ